MASLNKVMIIGGLGRDPEVSYTQTGNCIAKIAVATTETWNDKQTGEKKEKTEWHRVTFFGKQAETIGRWMSKGKQIFVEGKLQTSSYEKDGVTRYSTDIIASSFQFVGSKSDNQSNQPPTGFQNTQQASQQQNTGFQSNGASQNNGFQQTPAQNQGFQGNQGFQTPSQNQGNQGFNTPPEDD